MRRKVESIRLEETEGGGGTVEVGAYLGHEANLLGQIHQPDEISLGPLWSGDTSSIPHLSPPPRSHTARGRFVRRWDSGPQPWVRGHREEEHLALVGAAQEISIPLGSFFKVQRASRLTGKKTSNKFRSFVSQLKAP